MKILICDKVGESGIKFLKGKGYDIMFKPDITPKELVQSVWDANALMVRGRTKVTKEVIDAAGKLKVIARSGTGVDTIDLVEAKNRNIVVVNAPGANAESVAEHVFTLMLTLARNLIPIIEGFKKGQWKQAGFSATELKGKTLGVLGFGHIGKRVVQLGRAFGMDVLVHTKTHDAERVREIQTLGGRYCGLEELLKRSDIVSVHIPLNDQTRGSIGKKELNLMKKNAFLINTARGAILDENALIEALRSKTITAAALDVFTLEPLSPKSLLFDLPNVILTPHVGADSVEAENRASLQVSEDIDRVLQGQQPIRPVKL